MRKITLAILLICATVPVARGDEVVVSGMPPYAGVKVLRVNNCQVIFTVPGGRQLSKGMSEVKSIIIDNQEDFNKAEKLLRQGQPEKAVTAYDAANKTTRSPLIRLLVHYRRLDALDQAGYIDIAVRQWLVIVDENNASKQSLALRPKNPAPKGSPRNKSAIEILRKRKEDTQGALAEEIQALLDKLYRVEGKESPSEQDGDTVEATDDGQGPRTKPFNGSNGDAKLLDAAEELISGGQAQEAMDRLEKNLDKFDRNNLPRALLLMGKARQAQAQLAPGEKADEMLISAGLNYMKVVAHFPHSPQAPQALYLAGKVNASFSKPNIRAAKNAFNMVIQRYDKSEYAQKAKRSLTSLEVTEEK